MKSFYNLTPKSKKTVSQKHFPSALSKKMNWFSSLDMLISVGELHFITTLRSLKGFYSKQKRIIKGRNSKKKTFSEGQKIFILIF